MKCLPSFESRRLDHIAKETERKVQICNSDKYNDDTEEADAKQAFVGTASGSVVDNLPVGSQALSHADVSEVCKKCKSLDILEMKECRSDQSGQSEVILEKVRSIEEVLKESENDVQRMTGGPMDTGRIQSADKCDHQRFE